VKHLRVLILALAAAGLLASASSALAATTSGAAGAKVGVAGTNLGRILVDGRGHTLYLFGKDAHGKSACTGQCVGFWPPLITSGKPLAISGVKASLLGTTRRADGRLQVTYNRHPLYTFVKDTKRGQTAGEEVDAFGGEWYALSAKGSKVEAESAPTSSGSSSDSSNGGSSSYGGYGY